MLQIHEHLFFIDQIAMEDGAGEFGVNDVMGNFFVSHQSAVIFELPVEDLDAIVEGNIILMPGIDEH